MRLEITLKKMEVEIYMNPEDGALRTAVSRMKEIYKIMKESSEITEIITRNWTEKGMCKLLTFENVGVHVLDEDHQCFLFYPSHFCLSMHNLYFCMPILQTSV